MFYLLSPEEMRKNFYGLGQLERIIDRSSLNDEFDERFDGRAPQAYQTWDQATFDDNTEETRLVRPTRQSLDQINQQDHRGQSQFTQNQPTQDPTQQQQQQHQEGRPKRVFATSQPINDTQKLEEINEREEEAQDGQNSPAADNNIPQPGEENIYPTLRPQKKQPKAYRVKTISKEQYGNLVKRDHKNENSHHQNRMNRSASFGFRGGNLYT